VPTIDEKIWKTVASIPLGSVATYGQIADLAGLGRAARRVGAALRKAPDDMDLPWHRVINAAGKLSLPPDSKGFQTQRQRLQAEGILVNGNRVNLKKFQWQPSLDELLWQLDG